MLTAKPWTPRSVVALSSLILGSVACSSLLLAILPPQPHFERFLTATAIFHGSILVFAALFLRKHQLAWSEAFGFNAGRIGRVYAMGLIAGVVLVPPALFLKALGGSVWQRLGHQDEVLSVMTPWNPFHYVFFGASAILGASIAEEILFRGIMLPTFCQLGLRKTGLWVTSLLYAAAYINLQTFLPLTLLGLVFAMLYMKLGNLWAPILAHAAFNAVNFGLLLFPKLLTH